MKALVGSWDRRPYHLLAEITALRTRVQQLQRELEDTRAENDALRHLVGSRIGAEIDAPIEMQAADEREVALVTR